MTIIIDNKAEFVALMDEVLIKSLTKHQKAVNPEKLHTIAEAARLLDKSYTTVKRMIDQKRIIATTDGKYISQQAINDYLGTK